MQLVTILLGTVSVLTFLSGLITFFGAKKGNRVKSAWFLAATVFATAWMISISIFLNAGQGAQLAMESFVKWIFVSAIMIDIPFLACIAWDERFGRILTYVFWVIGGILSLFIIFFPHLLYNDVRILSTGNVIDLNIGPLYLAFIGFFCLLVPAIVTVLSRRFFGTHSELKRGGNLTLMISFGISSIVIMVSDLVLPFFGNWQLSWLGPLAMAIMIISFYYTILRYKVLKFSSLWLKIFSYLIMLSIVAIFYMIIFALIFAALFKGSTPSIEVIALNFIMIVIFLLFMPAINEMTAFMRKAIMNHGQENIKKKDAK